ncbi:MAG: hypothetical protein HOV94_20765 [Saccharothrix sp.]|nr:hypothetical protein [Saccharothrix sp.]
MTFLLRFGGVCGVLSGLFIALPGVVEAFAGETTATSLVLGVSPALAVPLLTALYVSQPRTGFSAVGYAVNLLGLGLFGAAAFALNVVLFPLGQPELPAPTSIVLAAGALVFVVGTVMFAVGMLRGRVHPRPAVWGYAVALPVFTFAARLPDTPLTSALHVVVGVTLVWLAFSAYASATRPATSSSAAISTSAA